MHSGAGKAVTSLNILLSISLTTGPPRDPSCNSLMTLLNSVSEMVEFMKYEIICRFFGVMNFR